ncbi:MAG: serine/threonine protein kinase, partial [Proteobacteria bacterium]
MYPAWSGMQANSSSSIQAAPPAAIGRYRLLTRIASGGMGAVYLAETDWVPGSPPKRVALKVLHAHHGDDEEITSRFVDEGRVAGRIVHPNVVQVLDAGRTDEYVYMALEYVHGDTLAGLLRACAARGTPFPLGIVVAIATEFLEGLHAAHGATDESGTSIGLVHRDVSPQNILIGVDGRAYVTDFGVAKVKDRIRATRSGSMIGKTGYMAPEQVAGGVVSAKTDLYAAGIVLWECLAGAKLFDGLEAQIQAAVTRNPPPSVRTRRPEVPEALDALVAELLQHAPDRRPPSAHVVSERVAATGPRASREELAAWVSELFARGPRTGGRHPFGHDVCARRATIG